MYLNFNLHRMDYAVVLALTFCVIIFASADVYGSELITHEIDSKEIAINTLNISSVRKFQVYLPDGYAEGNGRYPVLYWLPGWSSGMNGGQYKKPLDDAIQAGVIPPTIAVFVDGFDRFMQGILFLNSSMFGNWGNFLISELIPFVDREYRTIPNMLGRGLMGWSAGGYSSVMLPLLHPNVWGALGANDACAMGCSSYGWPEGDLLEEYPKADLFLKAQIQIGATVAPNPDKDIGLDWPREADLREKWDAYCFYNQKTISQHQKTLSNLLEIALVVPEDSNGSCRSHNLPMISQLEAAGIPFTIIDSPGSHSSFQNERYISIAERLLTAMRGAQTSVSPSGKAASLWGNIKQY